MRQGKKEREAVKRVSNGGREEGINVEEKERRLGDITVSSHRPVLHCSYKDEHHRGGVGEGGERERTNEKHQERRERQERDSVKQKHVKLFPRRLVPSDEQTFMLHSQGIWQNQEQQTVQWNSRKAKDTIHMK